jgi:type III secretion protein U
MTRDEVERERRQTEGDPRHKLERRRLHREAIDPDAPGALRAGDFVVSGPRLAVALRYTGGAAAPVIVVRGEHLLAVRLTDQARALGVPIFYDPGLALGLIGRSDGQEIPSALHDAVAGIVKVMLEEKPGAW